MKVPIFQVDSFATRRFEGNPAAVVVLQDWLPDPLLQSIAAENNVSETAFVVAGSSGFDLRWFSPTVEVQLCGHATLATAYVLFTHGYTRDPSVTFRYQGGQLRVARESDRLVMDFPALPAVPVEVDPQLRDGLGAEPSELHRATNLMAVFDEQRQIEELRPDFQVLRSMDTFGVIVTAPGDDCDFVSRFFAPRAGIPEDPVTGSAHCTLIPYWSRRLGRRRLHARQLSNRGGELFGEDRGERVTIAGRACEYMRGEIHLD